MRSLPAALLFLLSAAPLPAHEPPTPASEREIWNQPVPQWREGPVRYALSDVESREYRGLSTRAERAAFIARFWAARDPNPYAAGNEAEEIFWQRVSAADELFTQTTIAGWRTDRGRVYIALGPPDEITDHPAPSVTELDPSHFPDGLQRWPQGELRPGHRGAVEWTYRSLKSSRADAGQKVTFIRDETGEYRLSGQLATTFRYEIYGTRSRQEASQALAQGSAGAGTPQNRFTASGASGYPVDSGPTRNDPDQFRKLQAELAQGYESDMRSVEAMFGAGQEAIFEKVQGLGDPGSRVTTTQFFGTVPLQNRLDFFLGSGGTSTLITLGVATEDLEGEDNPSRRVEIFGRLRKVDDPSQVFQFAATKEATETAPLQVIDDREHRLYEIRGVVPPGEYQVNLGVRAGNRFGATGDRVEVPDFSGDSLQLAGPILAEKISEKESPGAPQGFVLGRLRLLPKLEPVFRKESDFGFYFQVYHALPATGDGSLHLDLEYGISIREEGKFRLLGRPVVLADNASPAHAYLFPLKGWGAGEYLLTVTVTDRVTGQVQVVSTPFRVH